MKKVLYFTQENYNSEEKKITGQINAFKALDCKVDVIYAVKGQFFFNNEKIENNNKKQIFWSYTLKKFIKSKHLSYDKIYVRSFGDFPTYLPLFCYLKKISNNNLYFEIPTYPYYGEISKTLKDQSLFLLHGISLLFRKKYVKKIVTSQYYDIIWRIPTIKIVNAVDTTLVNDCFSKVYKSGEDLRLIAVAKIQFWHGFERLLHGLTNYYKNQNRQNVYLTVIGEGPEREKLIEITKKQRLEKYVTFLPAMFGEALQKEYAKAHVGIGSLGLYLINLDYTSTLKSIEYLHMGLPFISGYIDPKFQGKDFYKSFSNDDTPIDINELIRWRDRVKTSPEQMNRLAVEKYSWIRQMKKIVEDR